MRILDPNGAKCKELRPILKDMDPDFDIEFNYDTENYHITHKGVLFQKVPYGEFGRNLVAEIRHTLWLNRNGDIFDYVDRQNAKVEASEDRKMARYAESLAKDLRRPLLNNYYYGM